MTQVVRFQSQSDDMASERDEAAQRLCPGRPLSATTSKLSLTGNRDFGVKFIPADAMAGTWTHDASHTQASAPTPPPYRAETPQPPPTHPIAEDEDEDNVECHPFWMSWWEMLKGMGMIVGGCLKIPFVMGHGITKVFYYIPVLYGDESVRKWPEITGFASGCVAGIESLAFGIFDGCADWVVLPCKGARKEGARGFFKGIARGLSSPIFKLGSGALGLVSHPLFGIYKEAAKFKVVVSRDRRTRRRIALPV